MFGSRFGSQPAPTPPAAPGQTPPPPPGRQAPPPPPAAAVPAINLWVSINKGTPVLMTLAQAMATPTADAMPESGTGEWKPVASYMPATAQHQPAHHQPPAPAGAFSRQQSQPTPNGVAPANLFAGVTGAQVFRRGQYLEPGDYQVKVVGAEYKQGRTSNMVIVEVEILGSSYVAGDPQRERCNQVGSRASVFVKKNDSFLHNMKEIVLAVSGFDQAGNCRPDDDVVTDDECMALVTPNGPFLGAMCYLEAREIDTTTGGKFTRIQWWPCPMNQDGSVNMAKLNAIR